jgi:hypothetical protein
VLQELLLVAIVLQELHLVVTVLQGLHQHQQLQVLIIPPMQVVLVKQGLVWARVNLTFLRVVAVVLYITHHLLALIVLQELHLVAIVLQELRLVAIVLQERHQHQQLQFQEGCVIRIYLWQTVMVQDTQDVRLVRKPQEVQ